MMLTSREYSILLLLFTTERKFKIAALANYYGVSTRVIYYNAENISKYLDDLKEHEKTVGFAKLLCEDGYLWLESCLLGPKNVITNRILDDAHYKIVLNQEERQLELLYQIACNQSLRISDLADQFGVSKSTAIKDFDLLQKFFSQHGLTVRTGTDHSALKGDEVPIRFVLADYMACLLNVNRAFYRMVQEPYIWHFRPYYLYLNCLEALSFERLAELIEEGFLDFDFPYKMFCNCLCGIIISIIRDGYGKTLAIQEPYTKLIENMAIFDMAKRLIEKVNYYLPISRSRDLAVFITLLLAGCSETNRLSLYLASRIDFQIIAAKFVSEVCRIMGLPSNKQLIERVHSDIYQLCINPNSASSSRDEEIGWTIQSDYPELWKAVKAAAEAIAPMITRQWGQNEIARLVSDFIDTYEEQKKEDYIPNILVICNSGIVSSRFICRKLQSLFKIRVLGYVSLYEMANFIQYHAVDYIITTVPILEDSVKVIQVNSYLSESDLETLRLYLPSYNMKNNLVNQILSAVEENGSLENREKFVQTLENLLGFPAIPAAAEDSLGINRLIDKRHIILDYSCQNLEDAVAYSGLLLENSKAIDRVYVNEIVENVRHAPEYMMIGDNILMPHSRADEHVFRTSVSVIRLKEPIPLNADSQIYIKWIFTLATRNSTQHIFALEQLSRIISEKEMLDALEAAPTAEQFKLLLDQFAARDESADEGR